jgi:hypothetical protein
MNRRQRTAAAFFLLSVLILSQAGHVQGTITVTKDSTYNRINFVNDNLTFYFWYGPQLSPVSLNPTFAWLDNKQPTILYVVDLMGLYQYNSTQTDKAFQRNETARNATFSWVGNEAWSSSNLTSTTSGVTYNRLNLTLNKITNPSLFNFNFTATNLTLGATNYGSSPASLKLYKYSYGVSQARTDVFLNLTRWKWTPNATNSYLALMLGFYALNMTVIQRLGIPLGDYVVPDYNFISPEELKARYAPFDPSAFLLRGMNLTASSGATTTGGFYNLSSNETTANPQAYEHPLTYSLPNATGSGNMPFIKLQFASGNTALPGYFSFPGYAFGLDNTGNRKDTLNVAASYISTGNFARIFLSYPYFGADQLRHFFSFGVNDSYLPVAPTPAGVYLILPSLPYQQALIIAGIAVVSMGVALFVTRMARREA